MGEHLSFCRVCAAACGIVVTTDGDRVVRVRGDVDHPVSRGYTCPKGRALPAWHHDAARLDRPRLRGRAVGWEEALDDLAGVLSEVVAGSGPDAVALYLATGLAYDAAGQVAAGAWMAAMGSTAFYTAVTVDNAPVLVAAEMVAGHPMLNPVWDPSEPGLVLFVGTNPVVSHGYGTTLPDPVRRLRDQQAAGGSVWVLDPRRTETAALADRHLAVRPGSDVAVLAALAGAVLAHGADDAELRRHCDPGEVAALRRALAPYDLARAAAEAGVEVSELEELVEEIRARPGRLAVFCGTGTTMARDGILAEWLRWVLLVVTGSLDRPGGMRFNRAAVNRLSPLDPARPPLEGPASRPDLPRVVGQVPVVALADEIEAGNVRALVVTGGNPLTAFPEPARLRRALAGLDALVVVDVAESPLTELATHVLPATGQLERADLTLAEQVSLRSGLQWTDAVVAPVGDRRPVWWMLAALSQRLGVRFLGGADPEVLSDEAVLTGVLGHTGLDPAAVVAAGPRGVDVPVEHGWVHAEMLAAGRWHLAPPALLDRLADHHRPPGDGGLVLVPRREAAWSNSVRWAGAGDEAVVRVNPADAEALGLVDGTDVLVESAHGSVTTSLAVDAGVRPGVVSMTHGRDGAGPGRLTSASAGVDPLTTMPWASGLAVTVRPALAD